LSELEKAADTLLQLLQDESPCIQQTRNAVDAIVQVAVSRALGQVVRTQVGDAAANGRKREFRVTWRRPDGQLDHRVGEAVSAEHAAWTVALMIAPESGWVSLVSVEPVGA
jgi:hypothetical protein